VVVHAIGAADVLDELEDMLRRGPSGADVDRVETIRPEGDVRAGDFRIEV
jgi:hypothetical protein